MTAAEKHREEQELLKNSRMERIFEAAFSLFSENGIDSIAINDIAKKAEIGVASLYRYFSTKEEIAIQTATWAWNEQKKKTASQILSDDYEKLSGLEQLKKIFNVFLLLYQEEKNFLRFITFFDSFIVKGKTTKDRLSDYEKGIATVQNIVAKAILKGIQDKSINQAYKNTQDVLYFTLMHALFSLVQKLSLSGEMLEMDSKVSGTTQIETLSELLINAIKG